MDEVEIFSVSNEAAMRALGASWVSKFSPGDVVLLFGPLGVGKTTLIRGMLSALGVEEPVRSPTFNLIQVFETLPPVVHADLFRLENAAGLGLEDYFAGHLVWIEWAERIGDLINPSDSFQVHIEFADPGRRVKLSHPTSGHQTHEIPKIT